MKRWVKVLIIIASIVTVLTIVISVVCFYLANKMLNTEKTFDMEDYRITLTEKFRESDAPTDTDWLLDGLDICVMGSHESRNDLEMVGIEIESLDEYITLWIEANAESNISGPYEYNGLQYAEYADTVAGTQFSYMAVFYESSDSYHVITFWCVTEDYPDEKLQFLTWAQTVEFDN